MHINPALPIRVLLASSLLALPAHAVAQDSTHLLTIAPNLARTSGTDVTSGVVYTRLYLSAEPSPSSTATNTDATLDLSQPTLTAQCTRRPNGKLFFELFVNFGGVTDTAFYHPWTPADGGAFAPSTAKVTLTMEFLGYTRVKPMKRQWERVDRPEGQLRYTQPGYGTNLEEVSYFFQYLRALPTLRLTGDGRTASFLTTTLQTQLHKEPLCSASGL